MLARQAVPQLPPLPSDPSPLLSRQHPVSLTFPRFRLTPLFSSLNPKFARFAERLFNSFSFNSLRTISCSPFSSSLLLSRVCGRFSCSWGVGAFRCLFAPSQFDTFLSLPSSLLSRFLSPQPLPSLAPLCYHPRVVSSPRTAGRCFAPFRCAMAATSVRKSI
jgi:hypothetical protein